MTISSTDRITDLEHKLDRMSDQLDVIAAELREQRLRRQQWQELISDLGPISSEAMALASRELESVQEFVEPSDMLRLMRRILRNTNNIEEGMAKYESAIEFIDDLAPLTSQAFTKALEALDNYESRGYFEFAGAGLGVVDRIVTTYTKEDAEALGENVVQIIDIVKDLTQPEMLAAAERLLDVVHRQAQAAELEPEEAPGLFALAGKMRDPDVRMGIARALNTFKAVSASESDVAEDIVEATAFEETNTDTPGGA
ncbi:MAG: DUF1641 domain-containing protein [Actinomycetota bacterium]